MTDLPGTPFVTGLFRPLVYLPSDFFQRFTREEQRWVVQHELTHAARGDLWIQVLWELLRGVFWFNPIVHLAAGAMRDDQELACDQAVLSGGTNEDRYSYGRALMVGAGAYLFPSLLNFFGNQKERIAMIRNHKASLRRDIVGVGLCALVGIFALTKAPVSVAELVSDEPLTLNFQDLTSRQDRRADRRLQWVPAGATSRVSSNSATRKPRSKSRAFRHARRCKAFSTAPGSRTRRAARRSQSFPWTRRNLPPARAMA